MTSVVFFKSAEGAPEGLHPSFSVRCLEVLRHDTESFAGDLIARITEATYAGVLLPSPRAVAALSNVYASVSHALQSVHAMQTPLFAVGPATASALAALGLTASIAGARGMDSLVDQILPTLSPPCTLLYLCGDNEKSLPREKLRERGVTVIDCVCYTTVGVEESVLRREMSESACPQVCVFFSPSGVETVSRCRDVWAWDAIDLLAIGTSTATALREKFGRCDGVPAQFSLPGVVELLNQKYVT